MTSDANTGFPKNVEQAAGALARRMEPFPAPKTALITGSGLNALATLAPALAEIPYADIPGIGHSQVAGHAGRLLLLDLGGETMLCFVGRRHIYEGIAPETATMSVRIAARLGVATVILTNAAGGLVPALYPGDLMMIVDHLNLMFRNPLIGPHDPRQGPRFPDMSSPYDTVLCGALREAAREEKIKLHEGVYAALTGPSYETPAEAAMLAASGADAVGMSTVPEVIAARRAGLKVAAISLITNSHVHPAPPPTHEEVLEQAATAAGKLKRLITRLLK